METISRLQLIRKTELIKATIIVSAVVLFVFYKAGYMVGNLISGLLN